MTENMPVNQDPQEAQTERVTKQPYRSPQLEDYGTVSIRTEATYAPTGVDGGFYSYGGSYN